MRLTFHGGAMSVTGANYLLEQGSLKILVDCGLFQGFKYAESLNYEKFSYNPAEIDYVFITHSHTDHIGRLPKLYKEGFRGKIFVVEPTKELMRRAFPDNWGHMAEEAKNDNHDPLYTEDDIGGVMGLIEGVPYHQKIELRNPVSKLENGVSVSATLFDAGHILGSAITCFEYSESGETKKIYFTGDLGNSPSLLLPDKEFVNDADYVVIESAYGSRVHENRQERSDILKEVVQYVVRNKGALMIPSFAVERTQEILFELHKLFGAEEILSVPVFVDSPLANKMTEVYARFENYLNKEARSFTSAGKNIFIFPSLRETRSVEESKNINDVPAPKIIIAGSGMSNGGRILHHERRYLPDPHSAIVFVGYQVEGSLGRKILDGQPEVNIFGEPVQVKCLVKGIGAYSAHADQIALVEWTRQASEAKKLKKVFVVQGEESSAHALSDIIKSRVHVEAIVPKQGESFSL